MGYLNKIKLRGYLNNDLIQGSLITIVGNGISRALLLIGTLFASNILGVEKFGQLSITRSTINVILVVAGLNLGSIITKSIAKYKNIDDDKLARQVTVNYGFIFVLSTLLSALTFIFSDQLSFYIGGTTRLSNDFKLSSIIIIFSIIYSLNESIFRGFEKYKQLGIYQIITSGLFCVSIGLGAHFNGVTGALYGILIYSFSYASLSLFFIYQFSSGMKVGLITFKNLKMEYEEIKNMTLPIFISSIIEAPVFWLTQLILIKNAGISANGILNALLQTRNLVLIIPGYISLVVLPILSRNHNNKEVYKKKFKQALKINILISIICIVPLISFPKIFLGIYGKGFLGSFNFFDSLLCYTTIPIIIVGNLYQQQFIVKDKGWLSCRVSVIWSSFFLLSTYVFCHVLSLAVLGYMISLFLTFLLQLILKYFYAK